jgi:hypothetical protein
MITLYKTQDEMNALEELIDEAQTRGMVYLDDFVNFIEPFISAEDLRHCIYEILRRKDKKRPTLSDTITIVREEGR